MAYNQGPLISRLASHVTRFQRIDTILSQRFQSADIRITDESSQHRGKEGQETHFRIRILSAEFQGLSPLERHRLINKLLNSELETGLHALSLHLFTPFEWEARQTDPLTSPPCRGGEQ